jgi:GH25 family lysozyme M1 (1,4-beta-N-acetylmuramidase)
MLQDISPIQKTWNKVVYGWDLMQIGQTLIVVPDLNHWLMVENDPEKLKTSFDIQKFADQVAAKGVTDIIFKATDATRNTGLQYTDKTAPFWHWLGGQLNLRRGAYHWLQYSVDPTVAWNYYRQFLDQYPCEWPHIMDFEEASFTNASDYLWRAQVWFDLANQDLNDRAIVYTGLWFVDKIKGMLIEQGKNWVEKLGWLRAQPLWLAIYTRYWPITFVKRNMRYRIFDDKPLWPWTEEEMVGWQYTARAHFPYEGYSTGEVGTNWGFDAAGLDLNYFRKSWLDAHFNPNPGPGPGPGPEPEPPVKTFEERLTALETEARARGWNV